MKNYILVATACAVLVACKGEAKNEVDAEAAKADTEVSLQTEDQKVSYSIGVRFGEGMGKDLQELDLKTFYKGFEDGFKGVEPKMTPEEMVATMNALQTRKIEVELLREGQDTVAVDTQRVRHTVLDPLHRSFGEEEPQGGFGVPQ